MRTGRNDKAEPLDNWDNRFNLGLTVLDELRQWAETWSDVLSLSDITLTVIGFGITYFGVWRSKRSAELARSAAEETRRSLARHDVIVDLASIMNLLEEVKRLHRLGAWTAVPDRYSELRRRLLAIKNSSVLISDEEHQSIQDAISALSRLEGQIERSLTRQSSPPNVAKVNEVVSTHLEAV